MDNQSRRTFLSSFTAAAVLGTSTTSVTAAGESVTVDGTEFGGADLRVTYQRYDGQREGGLVTSIDGLGAGTLARDLHTLVWDEDRAITQNFRDDGLAAANPENSAGRGAPEVPMLYYLTFETPGNEDYRVNVYQDVLVTKDRPAVLAESNLATYSIPVTGGRPSPSPAEQTNNTLFTVVNPVLGGGQLAGEYREGEKYDYLTVENGARAAAIAFEHRSREADGTRYTRRFDGHRFGRPGVLEGPERSAWADIYEENDGWIDTDTELEGELDAGFGQFIGKDGSADWSVCLGFGESVDQAVAHARKTLDTGYEAERAVYE